MSPEEQLDEARAKEALHRLVNSGQVYCRMDIAALASRLARENWTPPEPVDPDILAFREWASGQRPPAANYLYQRGLADNGLSARAYLAGARMAREQERERAKVLVSRLSDLILRVEEDWALGDVTGINASEMISAREALAKYRGEA